METSISNEKNVYDVTIAGVTVRLRSAHSEQFVAELSQFLTQQIKQAQVASPKASFQNILFLASLHIAEELLLTKKELTSELLSMKKETLSLLTDLEKSPLNPSSLET